MSAENEKPWPGVDRVATWRSQHQKELDRLKETNGWLEIDSQEVRRPNKLSDEPKVVFDFAEGGIIIPGEIWDELESPTADKFRHRLAEAKRFATARKAFIFLGVANTVFAEGNAPAMAVSTVGSFVCTQRERREIKAAAGVVSEFREEFIPDDSREPIRTAITSKELLPSVLKVPRETIDGKDPEYDYLVPFERVLRGENIRAEARELVELLHKRGLASILTLTLASVASGNDFNFLPFLAMHLVQSHSVESTAKELERLIHEFVNNYRPEDLS